MNAFTAYEIATGRIRSVQHLPESTADPGPPLDGYGYLEGAFSEAEYYVLSGALASRPESSVSMARIGADVTLTGVQIGARVSVKGAESVLSFSAEGGPVEFSMPDTGRCTVRVEQFPERPFVAELIA